MRTRVRREQGRTTISAKNQVTIPLAALRRAGLRTGSRLEVMAEGPGQLRLVSVDDPVERFAGMLTDVYEPGRLEKLRSEWR